MKFPLNTAWADNTTNKVDMSESDFSRGILYESSVESKIPNQALYTISSATKEIQEFGAIPYSENKKYPQGSVVSLYVAIGTYIAERKFIRITEDLSDEFIFVEKEIFTTISQTTIYKLKPLNSAHWQEISGFKKAELNLEYERGKVYDIYEKCYIYVNFATNAISLQKPKENLACWHRVLISSSIENNKEVPSADSLLKSWFVEDGVNVGEARIDLQWRGNNAALGYMLVNSKNINTIFHLKDFPRLQAIAKELKLAPNSNFAIFIMQPNDTFKIRRDFRGHFMRLYSNAHPSIDINRNFYLTQNPALPNIDDRAFIVKRTEGSPQILRNTFKVDWQGYRFNGGWGFSARNCSTIYTVGHNDVTPYNMNIALYVKI